MEITKAKNRSDGLLSRRVFQGVVPIPSLRISVGRCNHLDTLGRYGLKIRLPDSLPDAPRGWTLLALHDLDAASHKDLPHRGGASSLSSRQPRITDHGSRQFSGGCFPGPIARVDCRTSQHGSKDQIQLPARGRIPQKPRRNTEYRGTARRFRNIEFIRPPGGPIACLFKSPMVCSSPMAWISRMQTRPSLTPCREIPPPPFLISGTDPGFLRQSRQILAPHPRPTPLRPRR